MSPSTADVVRYEVRDRVATITLNRPEKLNAMNGELLAGTLQAIEDAAANDDVRALILTGEGRGFCAGGDLSATGTLGDGPAVRRTGVLRAYMRSSQLLREMPKVTIAAVNGAAAGAGLSWACATDLRYAAESAKFITAFSNAGLAGDFGGTWTLPRIVGPAKARELYYLSAAIDAEEAKSLGLVSDVFANDELLSRVQEIAQRLAAAAPITQGLIKQNLNDADHVSFAELLDREAQRHVFSGGTEDAAEAGRAFIEKRQPSFQGR